MNKIAMYEELLENHPLWSKEGGISSGLKALKASGLKASGLKAGTAKKMLAARPMSQGGSQRWMMKSTPSLRQNVGSLFKR